MAIGGTHLKNKINSFNKNFRTTAAYLKNNI